MTFSSSFILLPTGVWRWPGMDVPALSIQEIRKIFMNFHEFS